MHQQKDEERKAEHENEAIKKTQNWHEKTQMKNGGREWGKRKKITLNKHTIENMQL